MTTEPLSVISVVPVSSKNHLSQAEQIQYAVLPFSVQVASFAGTAVSVWLIDICAGVMTGVISPNVSAVKLFLKSLL